MAFDAAAYAREYHARRIPLSKQGEHGYANTQPAHPTCNIRKGNRV